MFNKANSRKGVTLVELIVALAIMTIVLLWVGHFVITGTNLSGKQSATADVHNEVQVASNFISDAIMSSQLGLSYQVGEQFVLNGASQNDTDKTLYIFNLDDTSAEKKVIATVVKWDCENQKIFVARGYAENAGEKSAVESIIIQDSDYEVLADHINEFNIDLSGYSSKNSANIHIGAKKMQSEYENDTSVHVRNSVIINADTIKEIYARISTAIQSAVLGVSVEAPSKSVPGGSVQLISDVVGVGFPSQDIFMWRVVGVNGDSEVEVYNSRNTETTFNTTIEKETKVLKISESIDEDTNNSYKLRVYAYVNTGCQTTAQFLKKLEDAQRTFKDREGCIEYNISENSKIALAYGYAEINILKITNLTLRVGDKQAAWVSGQGESETLDLLGIKTGDKVQMEATVSGYNLAEDDKKVYWSIEKQDSGIGLSLSQDGLLSIGRFSGGGNCVIKVQSTLDTSIYVQCKININNPYAEGTEHTLEITGAERLYRGAAKQLGLVLDGAVISTSELSDFIWSIDDVRSREGTSAINGATISNGRVVISEALSYDYSYDVVVKVQLKNNASVVGIATIEVPRVSINVTSSAFCEPGSKIDYGKINAQVIGIDRGTYELEWDIAKEGNESQYLKTYTNGTYILSRSVGNQETCELTVSSDDNNISFMRVRVKIKNHATYYATCLVTLKKVTVGLTIADPKTVNRGGESGTITLSAKVENTPVDTSGAVWTVLSATYGGTQLSDAEIAKLSFVGTGNTRKLRVDSELEKMTSDIIVTVQVEIYGQKPNVTVTVKGVTFIVSLTGSNINRGGTLTLPTYASREGGAREEVTWSVESVSSGELSHVTLSGNTLSLSSAFDPNNLDNTKITLKATGKTSGLEAKVTVAVNKVTLGAITQSGDTFTAGTVLNLASGVSYTIYWTTDNSNVTIPTNNTNSVKPTVPDTVNKYTLKAQIKIGDNLIGNTVQQKDVEIARLKSPTSVTNWGTRKNTKVNYLNGRRKTSVTIYGWVSQDGTIKYLKTATDDKGRNSVVYYYYKDGSWYKWNNGSWSTTKIGNQDKYVYNGNQCDETLVSVLNKLAGLR